MKNVYKTHAKKYVKCIAVKHFLDIDWCDTQCND